MPVACDTHALLKSRLWYGNETENQRPIKSRGFTPPKTVSHLSWLVHGRCARNADPSARKERRFTMKTALWTCILSALSLYALSAWIAYQPAADEVTSSHPTYIPAYNGTSTHYTPRKPKTQAIKVLPAQHDLKTRATTFLCDGLNAFTAEITRQRNRGVSQATVMAAKDSTTRQFIGIDGPGTSAMTYEIILLVYSHPTWSASQAQTRIEPLCLKVASDTPFVP